MRRSMMSEIQLRSPAAPTSSRQRRFRPTATAPPCNGPIPQSLDHRRHQRLRHQPRRRQDLAAARRRQLERAVAAFCRRPKRPHRPGSTRPPFPKAMDARLRHCGLFSRRRFCDNPPEQRSARRIRPLQCKIDVTDDRNLTQRLPRHSRRSGIPNCGLRTGTGSAGRAQQDPIIQVHGPRKDLPDCPRRTHPVPRPEPRSRCRRNGGHRRPVRRGKKHLLHILGALDAPTQGTVHCASTNVASLTPAGGGRLSQSRDWLRLAVSLPVAGVYGA